MMPRKTDDFERQLIGPYLYHRFNNISTICQRRYLQAIKFQNYVLISIGFLSAFSEFHGSYETIKQYAIIALTIATLGVVIYQQNKNFMQGWQNARFIAESVLSHAWLFVFRIGIYDTDEQTAKTQFADATKKIMDEVELKSFYAYFDCELPYIADWMQEQRNRTVIERKAFYTENRLDDQIRWYTKKSKNNKDEAGYWFLISQVIMIISILLAILNLIKLLPSFSYLGLFSVVISCILTWRQTKRFDELKVTYAVAANELRLLKSKFEIENNDADILRYVEEAEKSISREHKLWFNWTYIS